MTQQQHYCPGCNESFVTEEDRPDCPRCGLAVPDDSLAATSDLGATVSLTSLESANAMVDIRQELTGKAFSHYHVESFLGKGGMAWVFLARHNSLQRPCAIKILCPRQRERDSDSVEMFVAEARAAAALIHPHIVAVHNIGEVGEHHFIELEYVAGQSLRALAHAAGPLPLLEATEYIVQSCSALAEAHRCGFVHRDFKPANILIRPDGFAKLADFGLAKRVEGKRLGARGDMVGTPYYMAPELFAGQPATAASDVYAVGVSYFSLLTGRYPFSATRLNRLAELHRDAEVPDIRQHREDVPDRIADIISRCLSKQPAERPADGWQLWLELSALVRGLRDLPLLVAEALEGLDVDWQPHPGRIEVVARLPHGRRQKVYIELHRSDPWDTELVRIYSVCSEVHESYLRKALELNAEIPHGSLAIEDIDGQPHFVMLDLYPRSTCDVEELRHSVQHIARWADDVEQALSEEDRH